jgi:parallel beta-helix repeat protein
MKFPVPLLVLAIALGFACDRGGPLGERDEPFAGATIVVDDAGWTSDVAGDCEKATLASLPGPDGKTTLPDAFCVAAGHGVGAVRVRIDVSEDRPIRVPAGPVVVPPGVAVLDAPPGRTAGIEAGGPRVEGFEVDRPEGVPLALRRLRLAGFVSTALRVPATSTGAITIEDCAFLRNERGIFHEGRHLALRRCLFADGTILGIKTTGHGVIVEETTFARIGSPIREHGCYGFFAEGAHTVLVRRCRFLAITGEPQVAWAVKIDDSETVSVDENEFAANVAEEIAVERSRTVEISDNRIVAGIKTYPAQSAIFVHPGSREVSIEGNAIEAGPRAGITVLCSGGDSLTDNALRGDAETGIRWYGCDEAARGLLVSGNRVLGFAKEGVRLQGTDRAPERVSVRENVLTANGVGLVLSGDLAGTVIEDNDVRDARGSGIRVDAEASGVTLSRNRVSGSGGYGIEVLSRGNIVTNNRVTDNRGGAIFFAHPEGQARVKDDGTDDAKAK